MPALLRTILLLVIGYYVWKLIDAARNGGRQRSRYGRNTQREDDQTRVRYSPKEQSHIPDDEGDYIDYEDVK